MMQEIQIIECAEDDGVIAILAGEVVSYFRIELPDLSNAKLEKIIPGILSDFVAGDIENTHFAVMEKSADGHFIVAVCDHSWMIKAQEKAAKTGKTLKAIWPDYSFLATPDDGISVYQSDSRSIVRRANGVGFTVSASILNDIIGDKPTNPGKLAKTPPEGCGLATGKYNPRPSLFLYLRSAIRLGVILLAALTVWLIHAGITISQNDNLRIRYAEASLQIFKNTHPEVKRVVNVEAQMRALAQDSGTGTRTAFLSFANNIFKAIGDTTGAVLVNLNYDRTGQAPTLNTTISTSNFSQTSSFENEIANAGYNVVQGGSTQEGLVIFSSYTITGEAQ